MSCTKLLQDLVRYQDKVYHKNHHKVVSMGVSTGVTVGDGEGGDLSRDGVCA